jgi:hypothetical protein
LAKALSEWFYVPLGLLGLASWLISMWLLRMSDKADKAGVPATSLLRIARGLVIVAWIVGPTFGIFDPDGRVWELIRVANGIMYVVAFPVWVALERRRGTIRTRWDREAPSPQP